MFTIRLIYYQNRHPRFYLNSELENTCSSERSKSCTTSDVYFWGWRYKVLTAFVCIHMTARHQQRLSFFSFFFPFWCLPKKLLACFFSLLFFFLIALEGTAFPCAGRVRSDDDVSIALAATPVLVWYDIMPQRRRCRWGRLSICSSALPGRNMYPSLRKYRVLLGLHPKAETYSIFPNWSVFFLCPRATFATM